MYLTNSSFVKNYANTGNGGVIYVNNTANIKNSILLNMNRASKNFAGQNGSVLAIAKQALIIISYINAYENVAAGNGGILWTGERCDLRIRASTFTQNHANVSGGVVYNELLPSNSSESSINDVSNISVYSCKFFGNTAQVSGGVMNFALAVVFMRVCAL